jgi:hypothetical protein
VSWGTVPELQALQVSNLSLWKIRLGSGLDTLEEKWIKNPENQENRKNQEIMFDKINCKSDPKLYI